MYYFFIVATVILFMIPPLFWFLRNFLRIFQNYETYGFNKAMYLSWPICFTLGVVMIIIFFFGGVV